MLAAWSMDDTHLSLLCQERTPGVGREEEAEEVEGEGEGGEGVMDRPDSAEVEETRRKMAELEAKIEEACSEENFDLAGIYTVC